MKVYTKVKKREVEIQLYGDCIEGDVIAIRHRAVGGETGNVARMNSQHQTPREIINGASPTLVIVKDELRHPRTLLYLSDT